MKNNLPKHWLNSLPDLDEKTLTIIDRLYTDDRLQMARFLQDNSDLRKKISSMKLSIRAIMG